MTLQINFMPNNREHVVSHIFFFTVLETYALFSCLFIYSRKTTFNTSESKEKRERDGHKRHCNEFSVYKKKLWNEFNVICPKSSGL